MPSNRHLLIAATLAVATPARAVDIDSSELLDDIEIHGFVSQGYIKTIRNNYLVAGSSDTGSFDMTEVGLNVTKTITDRMRVGVQLFGGGFVGSGKYSAKTDWFYLDYRWRDWLGVRAGRVKLPFGLYNEINDIDSARVPILLPQSTYPVSNRNFLLAQTGFELYGYRASESLGALEYRLYGGTIQLDIPSTPGSPSVIRNISAPYVVGGRLMWEAPLEGLRLGGSVQVLRLDADLQSASDPTAVASVRVPALLWIGSLEYTAGHWLFAAEYSQWGSETTSSNAAVTRPRPHIVSERFYALLAYHALTWLHLGSYFSVNYGNIENRGQPRQNYQYDLAGTLRFDLTENWLLKLEGHWVQGTLGLSPALNDNRPITDLSSRWAVFLLKTTAYF